LFGIYPINKENHLKLKKKLSFGKKNFLGWVDQIPHKYFYANNGDLINCFLNDDLTFDIVL